MLKKQGEEDSPTASAGTQSEFSEIAARGGTRARSGSMTKNKAVVAGAVAVAGAGAGGKGAAAVAGAEGDRRQPSTTIATEADGSWARKTFN